MIIDSDVLVSFVGVQDPFSLGLIEEEEQPGPILSLVRERPFKRIVLISTPQTTENTQNLQRALAELQPNLKVDVHFLPLYDPTDYADVMRHLRLLLRELQYDRDRDTYFVSVTSGTPQMHACWAVLVEKGVFPATILQIKPPNFATGSRAQLTVWGTTPVLNKPFKKFQKPMAFEPEDDDRDDERYLPRREPPPNSMARMGGFPIAEESREYLALEARREPGFEVARQKLGIIGDHTAMEEIMDRVEIAAPTDMTVLLLGETGTGKELFARLIHQMSDRSAAPFVPINCGAIPPELAESTLFGHVRGAFTGATRDHAGKFRDANRGTLFLDELGELPPAAQVKLLRVIEDGVIEPVGSNHGVNVDVRIVAATNQDLAEAIAAGTFREDLYYRLNTVMLRIPPLRERASDIPKIAAHIMTEVNARLRVPKRFSREALARLERYPWPGNVRDLRNALTQSALFCRNEVIEADDLILGEARTAPELLDLLPEPREGFDMNGFLESARKQLMLRALQLANGNQSQAARLLGVTPQAVNRFVSDADNA